MRQLLLVFAHPRLEASRVNRRLLDAARSVDNVTIVDLYERYPTFDIDVEHEQRELSKHDVMVWHHPFYWYSAPPLFKQWIDLVLTFGWAYGPGGTAVAGKSVHHAVTTGGGAEAYSHDGRNRYTIQEFLRPYEQTARLCGMSYHEPFAVHGTHRLTTTDIETEALRYRRFLEDCLHEH